VAILFFGGEMKKFLILALVGSCAAGANAQLLYASQATDTVLTGVGSAVDDTTYSPVLTVTGFTFMGAAVTPANFRVNNNGWVNFAGASTTWSGTTYGNVAL